MVLNYAMDDSDPIFAHQVQAVEALSKFFEEVTVVTGKIGRHELASNIRVISTEWEPGKRLRSFSRFYLIVLPLLFKKNTQVFSHMTEVQSALIAPLTRLFRIRHYLWYAHTSNSYSLRWCYFWLTGIITSTTGSCPIVGNRVYPVGQGIDVSKFLPGSREFKVKENRFVHFGRFDPSKNIAEILETCSRLNDVGYDVEFTQIGSSSNDNYAKIAQQISRDCVGNERVIFLPFMLREQIPREMTRYSAFIHAYRGSLDKSLVEATLLAIPVISVNPEYLRIFGSWTGKEDPSLFEECQSFLDCSTDHRETVTQSRRNLALQSHSLENWSKLVADFFN